MLRYMRQTLIATALAFMMCAPSAWSQQSVTRDDNNGNGSYQGGYDYGNRAEIDRYLGVQVWTDHNDGQYYAGDRIEIDYRTNRDAFVAIYSIDSRGRVDLLFPAGPNDDNYVKGGVTYSLPGPRDDYDLVVQGPEGAENIQIIASREPFPIPDWYPNSGLICNSDDRYSYMDWLNDRFFVRYGGQRFAYDRTAIYVNEWEQYYFRPVYYPTYQPWTLTGNMYIDYPFGASVYINGIYWGCAPLYIPRVWVGWCTVTVYDRWGYCWESDVHVSRYHTLVLGDRQIRTSPTVRSKYRDVVTAGYRNPIRNGYPNYAQKAQAIESAKGVTTRKVVVNAPGGKSITETMTIAPKKHVIGSADVIKTSRGYETAGTVPDYETRAGGKRGYDMGNPESSRSNQPGRRDMIIDRGGNNPGSYGRSEKGRSSSSSGRSDYYQKKSSGSKPSPGRSVEVKPSKGKSENRGSSAGASRSKGGSSGSVQPRGKSSSERSGGSSKPSGGSGKSGGSSKGKGRG